MRNLLFEVVRVIDIDDDPDIWIVFQPEKDLHEYHSLYNLLWTITFDASKVVKNYLVNHSTFYNMITKDAAGKMHIAQVTSTVCELLQTIANIGMIYGNLRLENIVLKLDRKHENIERIRFLGFGSLSTIENSEFMNIPE